MAVTMAWKVYGAPGHRQRESFCHSYVNDFSENGRTRIIEVENSDKSGTNDYTLIRITRDSAEECLREMRGQLSDGVFENSRIGVIELTEGLSYMDALNENSPGCLDEF